MITNPLRTAVIFALLAAVAGPVVVPAAPADPAALPAELADKEYLFEVVRHLYRWYLDEADVRGMIGVDRVEFHVRPIPVELDPGDRSLLGEIAIPALKVTARVKKADYTIEELGLTVRNETFKIINVARGVPADLSGWTQVEAGYVEMREFLFRTRNRLEFPADDLLMRLRVAARREVADDIADHHERVPTEPQPIHVSSMSPVANEVWVFWEGGRLLIRFSSDIDLVDPAVWEHEDLAVDIYDIDEQVVVSLDEVAGSNAYLTRDQVGRALFNCVILGQRIMLEPLDPALLEEGGE